MLSSHACHLTRFVILSGSFAILENFEMKRFGDVALSRCFQRVESLESQKRRHGVRFFESENRRRREITKKLSRSVSRTASRSDRLMTDESTSTRDSDEEERERSRKSKQAKQKDHEDEPECPRWVLPSHSQSGDSFSSCRGRRCQNDEHQDEEDESDKLRRIGREDEGEEDSQRLVGFSALTESQWNAVMSPLPELKESTKCIQCGSTSFTPIFGGIAFACQQCGTCAPEF